MVLISIMPPSPDDDDDDDDSRDNREDKAGMPVTVSWANRPSQAIIASRPWLNSTDRIY